AKDRAYYPTGAPPPGSKRSRSRASPDKRPDADPCQRLTKVEIGDFGIEQPDGEPQRFLDMMGDPSQVFELGIGELRLRLCVALDQERHTDMRIRRHRDTSDVPQSIVADEL